NTVEKLSPLEVSSRYLEHIRNAWDEAFTQFPLAEQDVIITLPASFDEVARELTISAAKLAGLPKIVLLEEPQAAFYAFIYKNKSFLPANSKILVCDIGGGTTDLTLIRTRLAENGKIRFHRVAVGEHLILGGDNFDLALAHYVQNRLAAENMIPKNAETENGKRLPLRIWSVLVRLCCQLKEQMLGDSSPEKTTITIPGLGSKLIGGSLQIEITREEVRNMILDGFFPQVPLDSKSAKHRSGFREFGLPYASDAAVTKHLAQFLTAHRFSGDEPGEIHPESTDPARPDAVLFNGGVFAATALKERLLEVITSWFSPCPAPLLLDNPRLDLSVARGAAYYGLVRRGKGERISAVLARTYYIGVKDVGKESVHANSETEIKAESESEAKSQKEKEAETPNNVSESGEAKDFGEETGVQNSEITPENQKHEKEAESTDSGIQKQKAICLIPASIEPDQEVILEKPEFELLIGEPVSFPLFVSSLRLTDRPGELFDVSVEQFTALPPIRTVLKTRRKNKGLIRVRLRVRLTEIGTLELFAEEIMPENVAERTTSKLATWKLEFDVRSATHTEIDAHQSEAEADGFFDESVWAEMEACIRRTFLNGEKASNLVKNLVETSGVERGNWPTSLLRRIGQALMENESGRKISAEHESRWLNLLGYSFRPGFGFALDDYRIDQFWKTIQGTLVHNGANVRLQWWILLRRIAGGLSAGQQNSLCQPLLVNVRALHKQVCEGRGRGSDLDLATQEGAEIWRLLGSLELLPIETKLELGRMILDLAGKKRMEPVYDAVIWALGRIGARTLLSGPLNLVISNKIVSDWARQLIKIGKNRQIDYFAMMELARKTDDPYRDLPENVRQEVIAYLYKSDAPAHFIRLVENCDKLDEQEQNLIFGESLPIGLRIA
ncbi:MAG: Hsp70 family protein, partial [Thermoguttaceae bacterium]